MTCHDGALIVAIGPAVAAGDEVAYASYADGLTILTAADDLGCGPEEMTLMCEGCLVDERPELGWILQVARTRRPFSRSL